MKITPEKIISKETIPEEITLASSSAIMTQSEQKSRPIDLKVAVTALAGLFLLALHVWIRSPAFNLPYFHNEDTAGITYSADLIMRGGLPLIDTVEMKAPGSHFLLAGWWTLMGRSLISAQALGVIWSALAAFGVLFGAWLLYRDRVAALGAGLLYVYLAPFTDSIDINYGAWMITPYIWASVALFGVARVMSPRARERGAPPRFSSQRVFIISWITVGALIALAALMKRQGAALFPLALVFAYRSLSPPLALISLIGGTLGFFGFAFTPYILRGHGLEVIGSYFLSASGWSYLMSSVTSTPPGAIEPYEAVSTAARLPRIWDGVVGLREHLPLSGLIALLSLGTRALLSLGIRASSTESMPSAVDVSSMTEHETRRSASARDHSAQDHSAQDHSAQDHSARDHSARDHSAYYQSVTRALIALTALSFLGAALGLRFFKGYYIQLLPGLIWLAVDPRGLPWSWRAIKAFSLRRTCGVHAASLTTPPPARSLPSRGLALQIRLRFITLCALGALCIFGVLCLPSASQSSWRHLQRTRIMRSRPLYEPARQIKALSAALIHRTSSSPRARDLDRLKTDITIAPPTLWVWGRWAWPAYFYLNAPSPTRYFKNLGVLTTQLNNTWRRGGAPTRFDPQTPWREAIAELQARPPRLIIIAVNEAYQKFTAFRALLQSRYRRVNYRELDLERVSSRTRRRSELFKIYELKSAHRP